MIGPVDKSLNTFYIYLIYSLLVLSCGSSDRLRHKVCDEWTVHAHADSFLGNRCFLACVEFALAMPKNAMETCVMRHPHNQPIHFAQQIADLLCFFISVFFSCVMRLSRNLCGGTKKKNVKNKVEICPVAFWICPGTGKSTITRVRWPQCSHIRTACMQRKNKSKYAAFKCIFSFVCLS